MEVNEQTLKAILGELKAIRVALEKLQRFDVGRYDRENCLTTTHHIEAVAEPLECTPYNPSTGLDWPSDVED